jgi:hypothetical protein
MFISIIYMFWATSCSSSGWSIVSIQHSVWVTVCRWLEPPDLHTRFSPTQSDTYQMLYWYNWFSWWWAQGCLKHVENWKKQIEKRIVREVGYLWELTRGCVEHKLAAFRWRLTYRLCNWILLCTLQLYVHMANLQSWVFFSDSSELHHHITLGEELRGFFLLDLIFPPFFSLV